MPSYEYVIPKGNFLWEGKGPQQFECKKDIMPEVEFYGDLKNNNLDSCTVDTKMGKANPKVNKCVNLVKNFFKKMKYPDAKLVYIVHGFKGDAKKPWLQELKNNLIKRYKSDRTVVGIVVWKEGARLLVKPDGHYPIAASNTWPIGNVLAYLHVNIAKDIKHKFLNICIGHSLGAHLCGFFSKMLKRQEQLFQVDRIIGLDPAGQIFQNPRQDTTLRLDINDAIHTEIIHTNAKSGSETTRFGSFGFEKPIGHTDIYVNGGFKQPSCARDVVPQCSHKFAYLFMVELAKQANEQSQCTARWRHQGRFPIAYEKLKSITKEEVDKLESAGFEQQDQNNVVRIGDLGIVSKMKGVFWVEVGETSETCRFSL